MTNALREHTSKHGLKPLLVGVLVIPHALDHTADAHLTGSNLHCSVEQIQVGKLAVCAIVYDMQLVVSMTPRTSVIVYSDSALQCPTLDLQALNVTCIVPLVVGINPGLRADSAIPRNEQDDILTPKTPALEVARQCENQCDARVVDLVCHVLPCSDQNNGFGCVCAGTLEDSIDVFVRDGPVRDGVVVVLGCDFEVLFTEDGFESL